MIVMKSEEKTPQKQSPVDQVIDLEATYGYTGNPEENPQEDGRAEGIIKAVLEHIKNKKKEYVTPVTP